jgi:hypothetical protein
MAFEEGCDTALGPEGWGDEGGWAKSPSLLWASTRPEAARPQITAPAPPDAQETAMTSTTTTAPAAVDPRQFRSFAEFYPFYLSEHADRTCRRLHFVGSSLGMVCLALLVLTGNPWWLLAGLVAGYAFAWIGHFGFEKNKPASFKRPLYSFMGDWAMYRDIWLGRIKL